MCFIRGLLSKSTSCACRSEKSKPTSPCYTQIHAPIFLIILWNFDQILIEQAGPAAFDKKKKKNKHRTKQLKIKRQVILSLLLYSFVILCPKKIGIFGFSRLLGSKRSEFTLLCPSVTSERRGISVGLFVFSNILGIYILSLHVGSSNLSLLLQYFLLFSITS